MNKKVTHQILMFPVDIEEEPTLIAIMEIVFDWSNKMGLYGHELSNLRVREIDENGDPLNKRYKALCCDIEKSIGDILLQTRMNS